MAKVIIGRFRGGSSGPPKISDDAYLTVLGELIDNLGDYPSGLYFVQVEGGDPPSTVMLPLWEEYGKEAVRPVSERKGKPGCCGTLVFAGEATASPKGKRVEMEGGYHCGLLCAGQDHFVLTDTVRGWEIVERQAGVRS